MALPPSGLGRGERAPDFVLPLQDGTPTRFYARAGGTPAVLLFCPAAQLPPLLPFATTLAHRATGPLALFAVQHGRPAATLQAPFPVFSDAQGTVTAAYRLGQTSAATCFVLSPNLQILTTLPVHACAATAHQVLIHPGHRPASHHAPGHPHPGPRLAHSPCADTGPVSHPDPRLGNARPRGHRGGAFPRPAAAGSD